MALRTASAVLQKPCSRCFLILTGRPVRCSHSIPASIRENTAMEVKHYVYGEPQKVLVDECKPVDRPLSGNQVLVKMMLAPVHAMDLDVINGKYPHLPVLPCVAGNEGVGRVLEVGPDVKNFSVGNWVIPVDFGFGTWRSHVVCPEDSLFGIPILPVTAAATMSVAVCTAYRLLKSVIHLHKHQLVMQSAANSSIGQMVIQLCSVWGIHTVNVVRDRQNVEDTMRRLKALGATHVITDRFLESDHMSYFIEALGQRPKLIIDCVGGKIGCDMAKYVQKNGIIARYGQMAKDAKNYNPGETLIRNVPVHGFWKSMWACEHESARMEKVVMDICSHLMYGTIAPPLAEVYSLIRYRDAAEKSLTPFKKAKVLIKLDQELEIPENFTVCEKHRFLM